MRVPLSSSFFSLGGLAAGVEKLKLGIVCPAIAAFMLFLCGISPGFAEDWERAFNSKKWPEAIVALKGELARHPEDVALHQKLATALVYAKRREEALRWLSRAVDRESSSARKTALTQRLRIVSRTFVEDATFQVFQSGTNALQRGEISKALASFTQAWAREPDNVEILVRLAQVHVLLGDADSAVEKLRTAQILNPFEPEILLSLAEALIQRGETAEGLKWVQKAKGPECAGCVRVQIEGLEKSGNLDGALAALEEALRKSNTPGRREFLIKWASLVLKREPTEAQLARIRRELEDVFKLSGEEPVLEGLAEATQFRAGRDLSLNRIVGRAEQKAQRMEAQKLLEQVESYEKSESES